MNKLRDLVALIHVALGVAALALGGGGSPWALVAFCLILAWAIRGPARHERGKWWTAGVALALGLTMFRIWREGEVIDAAIDFLLLLLAQRVINRAKARTQYQLILLSAIGVLIAGVVNTGLSLPILLCLYLPSIALALIVTNLQGETERLGPKVAAQASANLRDNLRPLLRVSAQAALFTALCGVVVFVVFPRFGMGWFLRGAIAQQTTSGFSEQVELGHFGTIRDDPAIVMRLFPDARHVGAERLDVHLRGAAFDHYENGRWNHSPQALRTPLAPRRGYWTYPRGLELVGPIPAPPADKMSTLWPDNDFRAKVVLEDIGTELLFAASAPVAMSLDSKAPLGSRARLFGATDHQWMVLGKTPGSISYEFASRTVRPDDAQLRQAVIDHQADLAAYIQVPDLVKAEIKPLVDSLIAGKETRYEQVQAILAYMARYRYTTDLPPSKRIAAGDDPVLAFLFETRRGHCEYFASAFSLLLRAAGIPSRHVTGYLGATYNDVGEFYVVRQSDAHAWVEIHFGEFGWLTFDPTPSEGLPRGIDTFTLLRTYFDALEQRYLEWVVDFDLGKQMKMVGKGSPSATSRETSKANAPASTPTGHPVVWGMAMVAALIFGLRAGMVIFAPSQQLVRIGRSFERGLARHAICRAEPSTLTALAESGAQRFPAASPALLAFARHYERLRFGRGLPSQADLRALRLVAKHARRELDRAAQSHVLV